jgi:hypothetical protein
VEEQGEKCCGADQRILAAPADHKTLTLAGVGNHWRWAAATAFGAVAIRQDLQLVGRFGVFAEVSVVNSRQILQVPMIFRFSTQGAS